LDPDVLKLPGAWAITWDYHQSVEAGWQGLARPAGEA
jgi:hypothetical protein